MASWLEASADNRAAAQLLYEKERYRSSVNRAYYAAYAAVTHLLEGKVSYPQGRRNPPNGQIPSYIRSNLTSPHKDKREAAAKSFGNLWKARVDADYRPGVSCDREIALNAIRECMLVMRELEVEVTWK